MLINCYLVVFELFFSKANEVASQCHLCALHISAIIGGMFDVNMK